jgi:hypothetical protein
MPPGLCEEHPELKLYGFYRKLNNGQYEIISFCKPEAVKMISFTDSDFNEMLDKYLPEESAN